MLRIDNEEKEKFESATKSPWTPNEKSTVFRPFVEGCGSQNKAFAAQKKICEFGI